MKELVHTYTSTEKHNVVKHTTKCFEKFGSYNFASEIKNITQKR